MTRIEFIEMFPSVYMAIEFEEGVISAIGLGECPGWEAGELVDEETWFEFLADQLAESLSDD